MKTTLSVITSHLFCVVALILPSVFAAPGDLDLAFSEDGKLYDFLLRGNDDVINATAIQADGKIIAVGESAFGGIRSCAVSRYNVDGSLDSTFDADGMWVFPTGQTCVFSGVAVQSDGKIVAVGRFGNVNSDDFIVMRFSSNGSLDPSFDSDGIALTPIGTTDDEAADVAIQPNGDIVVAGRSWNTGHSGFNFTAVRYKPTGALDTSFDTDGKAIANFSIYSEAYGVAIQPDGKIVLAGSASLSVDQFAVARFNTNGSLDNSFDGDGKLFMNVGDGSSRAHAVEVHSDGKIVVGGHCTVVTGPGTPVPAQNVEYAALRLNPDGTPDASFGGGDGIAISHVTPFNDIAWDLAIQPDGKVILAGAAGSANSGPESFAVIRLDTTGALDNSFNGTGRVISAVSFNSAANSVSLQADGRIVAAGSANFCCGSGQDFAVQRFNTDGTPDNSFSTDSKTNHDVGFRSSFGRAVAMQPNGKFVVAGVTADDFAVIRYNADGTHDTSFDGDGKVVTALTPDGDELRALAIQADGKVVVTGYAGFPFSPPQSNDTVVVRYKNDGSLDETFDSDGKLFLDLGVIESATAVAIQPDGKIVTAGYVYTGGEPNVVVMRLNTNGSFDNSFDTDGQAIITGLVSDQPTAIALQPDGKIVVVGSAFNGTNYDFLVVRVNSDGSPDNSFDGDGKVLVPVLGGSDVANAIAIQPDGRIIAAGFASNGSNDDFAIVRLNSNGTLDSSFDMDGKQTSSLLTTDTANAVAVQQNGKILLAGASSVNTNLVRSDFAMVRYNADGTLDNSFSQDGKLTLDLWGTSRDEIHGMVLDSNGRAVVAGQGASNFAVARIHGDFVPNARARFDFDGDGRADVSVYRPSTGVWYQLFSSGIPYGSPTFGVAGDIPIPADFDGDAKTDTAIYRPSTGDWWYRQSSDGTVRAANLGGQAGDVPLPADVNNDGTDDLIIFRPSNNGWYRMTTTGVTDFLVFGVAGDKPLIGDFDGDGKADQAIFRPSTGDWWYSASSAGGSFRATHWGQNGDVPAPADFDGDGKTDLAVFRPSNGGWYILNSGDLSFTILSFGLNDDRPVPADYDGDGRADIGVFRPSTGVWYVIQSTSGTAGYQWGLSTDVAIPNAFGQP